MVLSAVVNLQHSEIDDAFPVIDTGIEPTGSRILVQIRRPKSVTAGGIILSNYSKEAEQDNTQVAKVIGVGPLSYHNRDTMQPWPEGAWCKEGDFVFVPRYAGGRWYVDLPGKKDEKVEFVIFNDLDILGRVKGDPLAVKSRL
jgi:co-chaperonin GroES (HSP10)